MAVSGEIGSERKILKFLIKVFFDVALFRLVQSDILQQKIAHIFRIKQWKNNGILFKNIGKFCLLF